MNHTSQPTVIAGPCMAESFEVMDQVASALLPLAKELGFKLYFKASYDKANRSSIKSQRGPGLKKAARWFQDIKEKYFCDIATDVHEVSQVEAAADFSDLLQIPAFLCRQTDLIVKCAQTTRCINVKKGQFLSPDSVRHIIDKVRSVRGPTDGSLSITERGTCFGYGDLIVDMRAFKTLASYESQVLFDITHSTQQPASKSDSTGALRHAAPSLARAATATGYLNGYFLETHPEPSKALSDAGAQLDLNQAAVLLRQIIPLWHQCNAFRQADELFHQ